MSNENTDPDPDDTEILGERGDYEKVADALDDDETTRDDETT